MPIAWPRLPAAAWQTKVLTNHDVHAALRSSAGQERSSRTGTQPGSSDTSSSSMAYRQTPPVGCVWSLLCHAPCTARPEKEGGGDSRARTSGGWRGLDLSPLCVKWHRQPASEGLKVTASGARSLVFVGLVLRQMAHHLRSDTALRRQLAVSLNNIHKTNQRQITYSNILSQKTGGGG